MSSVPFFRSLGLFVDENFLSEQDCLRVCAEMKTAPVKTGKLYGAGADESYVDQSFRVANDAFVTDETVNAIRNRLQTLKPRLEEHFGIPLGDDCHGPDFVTYQPGGFFAPHRDIDESAPGIVQKRRVSLVLFLNSQSAVPAAERFGGGGLTFYGLVNGAEWEKCGLTLNPVAGLLVAFRPEVLHQVQPVTFGERHIIVFAFLARQESTLESSGLASEACSA